MPGSKKGVSVGGVGVVVNQAAGAEEPTGPIMEDSHTDPWVIRTVVVAVEYRWF
jgi:hypothetical protein